MTDPRLRFTETVEAYRKYRPDYPDDLLEWTIAQAELRRGDRVLDVGCGTGISSRLFAERGFRVTGVDPNPAMLAAARAEGGGPRYVEGPAEDLPVDESSADGAISGQAFHWFDLDRAIPELSLALRPGGVCVAFWNVRDESTPFLRDYERLLREHCSEYPVASEAATIERIREHPAVARAREAVFRHGQQFDRESLFGRAWSSSYVVHSVRDAGAFDRELGALFDRHQSGGRVEFRYQTPAIAFEPK